MNFLLLCKFPSGSLVIAKAPNHFSTKIEAEQEAIKRLSAKNHPFGMGGYAVAKILEDVDAYMPPPPTPIIRVTGREE